MLKSLYIQNFVLIDELCVQFEQGMTVLTGETGAGKSILVDALSLILGAKAETHWIRQGEDTCVIRAEFDGPDACVIERVFKRMGGTKNNMDGKSVSLNVLKAQGAKQVMIHAQQTHMQLLKPDIQLSTLDTLAQHQSRVEELQQIYQSWQALTAAYEQAQADQQKNAAEIDLLSYQQEELNRFAPRTDEYIALGVEQKRLASMQTLLQEAQAALLLLQESEQGNVSHILAETSRHLTQAERLDTRLTATKELLNTAHIAVQETVRDLNRYIDECIPDPERLAVVEARLQAFMDAARKYRVTPETLESFQTQLNERLARLNGEGASLTDLEKQIADKKIEYRACAEKISKKRRETAKRLAKTLTEEMQSLGMKGGIFQIHFVDHASEELTPHGLERVVFYVSTNPGQEPKPLAQVVSGGELSRLSLLLMKAASETESVPTLIFDEVDVGIGGSTAVKVGQLLRTLANTHQVLCVTHLAQVAASAHHHWQVCKTSDKAVTRTELKVLQKPAHRVDEIARMLSGVELTPQTRGHAAELLEQLAVD